MEQLKNCLLRILDALASLFDFFSCAPYPDPIDFEKEIRKIDAGSGWDAITGDFHKVEDCIRVSMGRLNER